MRCSEPGLRNNRFGETMEVLPDQPTQNSIESSVEHFDGKSNDFRLQDIEEQLEMAESRCNNLKDQLDYMKNLYGGNRVSPPKARKISNARIMPENSIACMEESEETKIIVPVRQKSNHIETDNTGAAVRTINNILNGITNSVNRLSEIHSQIATPRMKTSTGVVPRVIVKTMESRDVGVIPEIKIESTSSLYAKVRGQKRKAIKSVKATSQHTIKKASRVEKKSRSSTAGLEKRSSTLIKNRLLKKFNTKNNKLVEIYHNDAVKHSDSDDSNLKKSRQQKERETAGHDKETTDVPPLNIDGFNQRKDIGKVDHSLPNGFKTEFAYDDPPHAPRTTVSYCYSKNYELPTVASRMKQVAKSYLGSLNLKTIPFCAAISTTQSHNIGINIQQVMNIIKNRQPINGISPTLAHNIGLAAEKLNSKPFFSLMSTINSRILQTASRCPLSKTYLNIPQLQEQAKNIPEETIEEADEEASDSPRTQTVIITGPSGDVEIQTKNTTSWGMDKNQPDEQCTCVVPSNISFEQIASKYTHGAKPATQSGQLMDSQMKKRLKRYKTTRNAQPMKLTAQECQVETCVSVSRETQKEDTLNGREKNLKQVLANLHHDFDSLNRRYEDLSQKSVQDGDESTLKELERLETELNKKEEEITMVMKLYKEVLALKQQVKILKEKRSQGSLPSKETKIKFKEYNNPEAAFHLTKLLKQIQHYQMRYKSNFSQE